LQAKRRWLLLLLAIACSHDIAAQSTAPLNAGDRQVRFRASSLETVYAFGLLFEGTARIHSDNVELRIQSGTVFLRDNNEYKGPRRLVSVRAGISGAGGYKFSEPFTIQKTMRPGEEHSLDNTIFSIPIDKTVDLENDRLVFKVEAYSLEGKSPGRPGFALAESEKGVLSKRSIELGPMPLTLDETEKLLLGSVTKPRIIRLLKEYGVGYSLDQSIENRLRGDGADDAVVLAIVQNRR
jgi:hypothetical protein